MAIKVEDAIANLKNQMMRFEKGTEPDLALQMAIKALEECKPGKWISHIEHGIHGGIQCWVCSECRELFSYDAETGVEITNYHICPNCGAKMEGEEE